jgi:hypothetical protein
MADLWKTLLYDVLQIFHRRHVLVVWKRDLRGIDGDDGRLVIGASGDAAVVVGGAIVGVVVVG